MSALLTTWRGPVAHEWVDYNGHLNDAYYMVIFSYATDGLMAHIGLDEAGRKATGHTMYTLEVHLNYVQEVHEGVDVEVHTQILGVDAKRVHLAHEMYRLHDGKRAATQELMYLHVDLNIRRVVPWPDDVRARIEAAQAAHARVARPEWVGRRIAMPAPK